MRNDRHVGIGAAAAICLVAALLFVPATGHAQTGTIQGTVTSTQTGDAVRSAQVSVEGTTLGTVTNQQGRFTIGGVPAGEQQVEVRFIGYRTETTDVQVPAGDTIDVNIALEISAVQMDQIVATGTGAPTQRRELGQTISQVTSDQLETAPITTVSDALQGRVAGISGFGGGETGQGDILVLRGAVSLTQSNQPLIYVDGVRLDNAMDRSGMIVTNQLRDINPQDIDRIEVIKGAAAATLFGTEASSGVIQIFTKRGQTGAPTYTLQTDHHVFAIDNERLPTNYGFDASTGELLTNRPQDDFLDAGWQQNYTLSVRGGSESARYYASGRFMEESGFIPENTADNISFRSSLDLDHSDRLSSGLELSWVRSTVAAPQPTWGIFAEFLLANPVNASEQRPYGEQDFTVRGVLADENTRTSNNLVLSGNVTFDWTPSVRSTFRAGYNTIDVTSERFRPEGSGLSVRGLRNVQDRDAYAITLDANTSWNARISDRIGSEFMIGGQSFWEGATTITAQRLDFPSPTLRTLGAASAPPTVGESFSEVINAGIFVQEQLSLEERLFLTLGVRVDGNSAFGEDFGFETYPKAGLSWVISEEGFYDFPLVESLRLRGAVGAAGLQPGAFDAQRTWNAVSLVGNNPVVLPDNLGNPDLQPERSLEIEAGFEAGMFEDRLGLDVVYYHQTTSDALLPLTPAPSLGFLSSQLFNIGEMQSSGVEATVNFLALQRPGFRWDLNAAVSTVSQEVTDLGGAPPYPVGVRRNRGQIAEGFSPGAIITEIQDPDQPYVFPEGMDIMDIDDVSDIVPNILQNSTGEDSLVYLGDALPNWTVNLGSTMRMGESLSLRAVFSGAGGFLMHDETDMVRTTVGVSERGARVRQVLADPNSTREEREEAVDAYGRAHPLHPGAYYQDGDYLRLTELSLTYELGEAFTNRLGIGGTSITLSGRNLYTFTGYDRIADPGAGWHTNDASLFSGANVDYFRAPLPQRFVLTVQTSW